MSKPSKSINEVIDAVMCAKYKEDIMPAVHAALEKADSYKKAINTFLLYRREKRTSIAEIVDMAFKCGVNVGIVVTEEAYGEEIRPKLELIH